MFNKLEYEKITMNGKEVSSFVMVFLIAIVLVAAGVVSYFVVKEPGVLLAPGDFDASLTIANTAPVIDAIYDVVDEVATSGDRAQSLGGNAAPDSINTVIINFLARDVNGVGDLPITANLRQTTSVGQLGLGTCGGGFCNIELYIENPGIDGNAAKDIFADAGTCVQDVSCPNTVGPPDCPQDSVEYSCTVSMDYFDEPGFWDINVGIADNSNTDGDEDSLENLNTFEYLVGLDFGFVGTNDDLSWNNIDLTATDQVGTPGSSIDVENLGNDDLVSGTVKSENLLHSGSGDPIPGTAFSVSTGNGVGPPPEECEYSGGLPTANQLTPISTDVAIFEVAGALLDVQYGRGSPPTLKDIIYFCLWEQLDLRGDTFPASGTYSTTGTDWQMTLSN